MTRADKRYVPASLSVATLYALHEALERRYASTDDPVGTGVRDAGLLESAAQRPLTALRGTYKYCTQYEAAAALGHSIVNSHPFIDGNKRTSLMSMMAMLDRDHLGLTATNRDAVEFMLRVTKHELVDPGDGRRADPDDEVEAMASWLHSNSRATPLSERRLEFRDLLAALKNFGVEHVVRSGNAVDLLRDVRGKTLRVQIGYNGRGNMNVDPATVRRVRAGLELGDAHGVDQRRFYDGAPPLNGLLLEFRGALDALAEYDRAGSPPQQIKETRGRRKGS